jgi:hypothetical protein
MNFLGCWIQRVRLLPLRSCLIPGHVFFFPVYFVQHNAEFLKLDLSLMLSIRILIRCGGKSREARAASVLTNPFSTFRLPLTTRLISPTLVALSSTSCSRLITHTNNG